MTETELKLTGKKKITVSDFKGKPLVHIREYYEKDGKEMPGKKGIALSEQDWKLLKEQIPLVDEQLAKSK